MTTPLGILSDNPTGNTGLGRITRQLADRIHANMSDIFKVGVIGMGSGSPMALPYSVYPVIRDHERIPVFFPEIWQQFTQGEPGILLTITNACWLEWLAFPEALPPSQLRSFLLSTPIKKWCYVPVDSESLRGQLPAKETRILERMDRLLAYTQFGESVIARSASKPDSLYHLPHGTDSSVFYPRDRSEARKSEFGLRILKNQVSLDLRTLLLGCVATNSQRKDWPLAFKTLVELKCRGENVGLWAHTNQVEGYWDLVAMADGFGVRDRVQFTTGSLSDEDLAWGYSACDVTLGIGSGEGWGFPMSESLACGVPVVTGNYAGATDFVDLPYRVMPEAWREDGFYCNLRPTFRAADWAEYVLFAKGKTVQLDPKFTWDGCWPAWEEWLREND